MTKIDHTLKNGAPTTVAATKPVTSTRRGYFADPRTPRPEDRITLSEAGLTAAARYSNLIPRSADSHAPALPAPAETADPAPQATNATDLETPSSRNLVRSLYSKQQKQKTSQDSAPGARIDIRA
jgi:hypothetical protein